MINYENCTMCPRSCSVDRRKQFGYCSESDKPRLAWCGLHRGEEPVVSGDKGSGMLFFTGCTLGCRYCQNYQISLENRKFSSAVEVDVAQAEEICFELRDMGAHTISFVTAEHFTPFVIELADRLKKSGFNLPLVYNTSGYMSIENIKALLTRVDLWLWDTKAWSADVAEKYCTRADYADVEKKAFEYLCAHTDAFCQEPPRGIVVRHLVLPGCVADSFSVIDRFREYKDRCCFSLMGQFTSPFHDGVSLENDEYDKVREYLYSAGIEDGFVQEYSPDSEWIPDFNLDNPFPVEYAEPSSLFLKLRGGKR